MIDAGLLLADTKKQVVALIEDLRTVAEIDPEAASHVGSEYQRAHAVGRTAFGQVEWAEGLYAQVAVAWVLGCVFVRFCEDNELIHDPLLGGSGIRSQIALDHRAAHLQANPAHDDRNWLQAVFGQLRALPATGEIFGPHNPVWADGLLPSADGARKLREELTRLDPETGELRHDFTDPAWDTRFLGDLYQDLSEHTKKTYALLQTPVFVEEFILDRTLDPAIATFGLADTTIIDPTCGSGHFLLGAFARLFGCWSEAEPSTNRRELAQRALDSIGGIDLNPFAVSIARFRLLLAALRAGDDKRLVDAPAYQIHIAVGDSLLHGDPPGRLPGMHASGEEEALVSHHGYESEDIEETRALLGRAWSAVVGNPPYITVKDPALNAAYRARFSSCHRQYSLGVPFTERFWQLARADAVAERSGFVGMITANSFMKREFGRRLIETWVPVNDLSHVVDTSGAFIPGHGTPTVILFGRNRAPKNRTVRVVMAIRGEPSRPRVPARALVWTAICDQIDLPGSQSPYISVSDTDRTVLATHPWSIGGGGAAELKLLLEANKARLGEVTIDAGTVSVTRLDEAYVAPIGSWKRQGAPAKPRTEGEDVRDWAVEQKNEALWPYDERGEASRDPVVSDLLWPVRQMLRARTAFGSLHEARGLHWTEYSMLFKSRMKGLAITYPVVTTHPHFVLRRGGGLANPHAPVIQLAADASEDEYLSLLGLLNSSVACFWIKQVLHNKGDSTDVSGARVTGAEAWIDSFEFDNTKLKQFPIPSESPLTTACVLDGLAVALQAASPVELVKRCVPDALALSEARTTSLRLRAEMVGSQERLDWESYRIYGLVSDDLTCGDKTEPPLQLGERAFEIVLARRMAAGEEESTWFIRHGSTPITDLPSHWSPEYRQLVERRIELIEADLNIGLIERPEYKRRWARTPWDEQVRAALESFLLTRLEDRRYWPEQAAITTIARLSAEVRTDDDFLSVAQLYTGRDDLDLAGVLADLVKGSSVAYLAAHRYTDSGLRKHAEWLKAWEVQRREDAGEGIGLVPVPPKYGKPDFTGAGWEHRGKLDVPKERFISYPGAERETDASLVIGWAGWNHLDRARALAAWYLQARRDGRDSIHLTPLLAGLAELVPWLKQWYDEPNPDPALDRPGTQIAALVETELRSLGLIVQDLSAWRPAKKRSARAKRAAS